MADLLIKPVPLPVPRPIMEETIYGCSIDCRMPLEASRELADAFNEGGWYTPTSQGIKLTSELLMALESLSVFLMPASLAFVILVVVGYTAYRFQRWRKLGI